MARQTLFIGIAVGGLLLASGRAAADDKGMVSLGAVFGQVKKVEELGGVTRLTLKVPYLESTFERQVVDVYRWYTVYLNKHGAKLKYHDVTFYLRGNVKVRVVPPPVWNAKTERWDPPAKDPSDRSSLPGVAGEADDIAKDVWIHATLQVRPSDQYYFANRVIVYQKHN